MVGVTTLVPGFGGTCILPPSPMILLWTALAEPAFRKHDGELHKLG